MLNEKLISFFCSKPRNGSLFHSEQLKTPQWPQALCDPVPPVLLWAYLLHASLQPHRHTPTWRLLHWLFLLSGILFPLFPSYSSNFWSNSSQLMKTALNIQIKIATHPLIFPNSSCCSTFSFLHSTYHFLAHPVTGFFCVFMSTGCCLALTEAPWGLRLCFVPRCFLRARIAPDA